MQQALTNALLMDAVVGSLQSSKAIYAASKVAHFDRIKTEGRMIHLFSLNTIALDISAFAHNLHFWNAQHGCGRPLRLMSFLGG